MTVLLDDGNSEIIDWHPDDAEYVQEFSQETAYCEDVKSVGFYNALTNEDVTFSGLLN